MVNILQRSNYLIFFDDVRVDPYVLQWNSSLGLFADNARASITMHRAPRMDKWKAYLTQVRIFGENPFTKKFCMLFEGEITDRTWSENRSNSGTVTFTISGFYHWLDIPVPMGISTKEELDPVQRFIYEAQNIDIDAVREFMISRADMANLDKNIEELITSLFDKLTIGYYDASGDDTTFAFAKLKERFKVMVDVIKEFRQAGFLDLFTFTKASNIQSFYVYLNDVITQLMFEFYQDRDGSFRIKTPSWADAVLKAHTIDASLIEKISGMDAWDQEPTRILATGSESQIGASGDPITNRMFSMPVGLYIGNPRDPESEKYYSQIVNMMMNEYGAAPNYNAMHFSEGDWFNNLGDYRVTSDHRSKNPKRKYHYGVDLAFPRGERVYNIGTYGEVYEVGYTNSRGNYIIIKENINGKIYYFQYMHFDSRSPLKVGDLVPPGGFIGYSGTTGDSTGPHLHFEVWNGVPYRSDDIEPLGFINSVVLSGSGSTSSEVYGPPPPPGLNSSSASSGSSTASTSVSRTSTGGIPTAQELLKYGVTDFKPTNVELWQVFHISAYTAKCYKCSGITAGGMDVRNQSLDHRVVAVDPKVIPLGSIIEIDGLGFFTAYDTGGKIKEKRLDLLVRSKSEASAWGRRNMKIRVIRRGKGNGSLVRAMKPGPDFPTLVQGSSAAKYGEWNNLSVPKSGSMASMLTMTPATGPVNTNTYATVDNYTGFQLNKNWASRTNAMIRASAQKNATVKELTYPMSSFQYTVPSHAPSEVKGVLTSNPSGIDGNLLACIIASTSSWKENYKAGGQIGIAGINENYANTVLYTENPYDATKNIQSAAKFLSTAMSEFNGKVTFALAAYYLGGFPKLKEAVKEAGSMDFTLVREKSSIDSKAISFVDSVLSKYLALTSSTIIKGDPHKKVKKNVDLGDTEIPEDFEESYRAEISDEERRFKVNLKRVEQSLIRLDNEAVGSMDVADKLIYQFAKYMMQVYRARSHNISVSLATCLPVLRPGYNMWIEPTRTDVIAYITNISHYGSFGNGCSTSVTGGFVRRPDDYQEIDTSIFVGEVRATSETFGETLTDGDMDSLRGRLKQFHETETNEMAHNIPILKEIYSSMNEDNEYSTMWNKEYTKDEVIQKINDIYASAPQVVIERKQEIAEIISESEDFFMKKLLLQKIK